MTRSNWSRMRAREPHSGVTIYQGCCRHRPTSRITTSHPTLRSNQGCWAHTSRESRHKQTNRNSRWKTITHSSLRKSCHQSSPVWVQIRWRDWLRSWRLRRSIPCLAKTDVRLSLIWSTPSTVWRTVYRPPDSKWARPQSSYLPPSLNRDTRNRRSHMLQVIDTLRRRLSWTHWPLQNRTRNPSKNRYCLRQQ